MRLFLAVEVGDEAKEELKRLSGLLKDRFPHLRMVPANNLHITLRFIGEVPDGILRDIRKTLFGKSLGRTFEVTLEGVGGFPSKFGARVVWVGLKEANHLKALSDLLDEHLSGINLPPRDKPFLAHITVARTKRPVNVESFSIGSARFKVKRVVLYRSILAKPHAIYEPLEYYYLDSD
ncbi:MAG: RNA 2',3'-cyclic phosphodiesterase [Thermotogae bacterium]|nr:RNA 2',3'-cyclic phosphodiesterase [Thermotogota bacterium]